VEPSVQTPYEPRRLDAQDLRVAITPGQRLLPERYREEQVARKRALLDRTDAFGSHMQWRVKHYVLRAVTCVPLVTWLFTPLGFQALWIQLPVAALFGVAIAYLRPSEGLAGWLLLGTGALTLGLTGYFAIGFGTLIALFAYYVCGMFVGLAQYLRRMDGE
jgi:hypothetical protein